MYLSKVTFFYFKNFELILKIYLKKDNISSKRHLESVIVKMSYEETISKMLNIMLKVSFEPTPL